MHIFRNNKELTIKKFIGSHVALFLFYFLENPYYITHIYTGQTNWVYHSHVEKNVQVLKRQHHNSI